MDFLRFGGGIGVDVLSDDRLFVEAEASMSLSQRNHRVDVLRGLAVLGVLLIHTQNAWYLGAGSDWPSGERLRMRDHWLGILSMPVSFGFLGLNLFFLLSGFCIHLWTVQRQGSFGWTFPYKQFIARRLVRLYPAYVGAIAFSLLCLGIAEGIRIYLLGYESISRYVLNVSLVEQTFRYLTFTHTLKVETFGGYNLPLYTMAIEFHFYLLYPLVLWGFRRWGMLMTVAIVTALSLGCLVTVLMVDEPRFSRLVMDSVLVRWPEWVLGCVLAEQWIRRRNPWSAVQGMALGAIGLSAGAYVQIVHNIQVNILWTAGLYFLVVWYLLEWDGQKSLAEGWLSRLGLISYSVYLLHSPILRICAILMPPEPQRLLVHLGVYGLVVPCIILTGYGFFKILEEPFLTRRYAPVFPGQAA